MRRSPVGGEVGYTTQAVSRRTGLSPHVIRAWERRYQAVTPRRMSTNRRLYSEDEVRRLQLLRQAPLLVGVGERWRDGSLGIAHEHLAAATIRSFLGDLIGLADPPPYAPCIVATTPPGQQHELGALLAAASATLDEWRVAYLGPNLPAAEIAAAADRLGARAVALSIIYPADDPHLPGELRKLRRYLHEGVTSFVGGRAAPAYRPTLDDIGATYCPDLNGFRHQLDAARARSFPGQTGGASASPAHRVHVEGI